MLVLFAESLASSLSEHRDPEEVRELRATSTLPFGIERYGGTVEKFIGDAVMAVWRRRSRARMMPNARSGPRYG